MSYRALLAVNIIGLVTFVVGFLTAIGFITAMLATFDSPPWSPVQFIVFIGASGVSLLVLGIVAVVSAFSYLRRYDLKNR